MTAAGFTLLELILALALTGLLSLVVYTSLNVSIKGVQRSQVAAEQLQELRVAQTILERSLSSAVLGSLDNRVYFTGDPGQMRFFTLVPLEAHNLGGIYHWRVLSGQDKSGRVVLAVEQAKNINWHRDPEGVEIRQILIGGLAAIHFTYGRVGKEYDTWDANDVKMLPDWVKIRLTRENHQPVELVIPFHVTKYLHEKRSQAP